jgi:peptidoglycan/xylan/chitin deacetylase (PgdA/CDA1 family)
MIFSAIGTLSRSINRFGRSESMMINSTQEQRIPILLYHSISSYATPKFQPYIVPPDLFEEHLAYLVQCDYTSMTITQFMHSISLGGVGLPLRPVILTFDDGYADFYTHALPALQRHGIVATLYIPTAFVGATAGWLQREGEATRPLLTWSQLVEISASGIECGAHSHTHPALDLLPISVAHDEIIRSKELLEEHLNQPISSFAYPYGYYNRHIQEIVRTSGFISACAVKQSMSSLYDDPFALARLAITPDTKVHDLEAALSSGCGPLVPSPLKRIRTHTLQSIQRCMGSFARQG